jgi:ArsR family transcriptional regulator
MVSPIRVIQTWPKGVDVALSAFGNPARLEVLCFLRDNGASYFGDILSGVGSSPSSLARTLKYLEQDLGIIAGDVPIGDRKGRAPRYSLNHAEVREAIDALRVRLLD